MSKKDDAARLLAERHYAIEPGITRIVRLSRTDGGEDRDDEPVKLLEVNAETIGTGIQPLRFGPAPASGIAFSTIIIEVTPEEFQQIQEKRLPLPSGWQLGPELTRPVELNGVA